MNTIFTILIIGVVLSACGFKVLDRPWLVIALIFIFTFWVSMGAP